MEPNDEDKPFAPPPSRGETLVPALAVVAVAVVAVAAAVMARRDEAAPQPQFAQQATRPVAAAEVVHAPPLAEPDTRAMGSARGCRDCGVVQMVVAVYDHGRKQPRAFQMHVRMDDGSLRTVEQRGALAAGSRVVVDGSTVRPMS
jgi:hypothetical protein